MLRNPFSATPQATNPLLVEIELPVPVLDKSDDLALASLQGHPGITALLNRFKLQRALLTQKLISSKHDNLRDIDTLQLGISWSRYVESEIRNATKNTEEKRKPRPATFDEIEQFERIKGAIESVRPTGQ